MTKKDNEDFENSTKCWICDNAYFDGDVKVTDHCHFTGKYRGFAHRDCNKLNLKIPVIFHTLKTYDSHLIMQEQGKLNLKIKVIPKQIGKVYNKQLSFIDSFRFLSSSLDSFIKKLAQDDFKYLNQEFHNNILDLVKQKGFCSSEYMSNSEKFKEQLPSKEKFYSSLTGKKISYKEHEHVLKGCVSYIFASLFCMSKREHLRNKGKCFLFHFESSFCS